MSKKGNKKKKRLAEQKRNIEKKKSESVIENKAPATQKSKEKAVKKSSKESVKKPIKKSQKSEKAKSEKEEKNKVKAKTQKTKRELNKKENKKVEKKTEKNKKDKEKVKNKEPENKKVEKAKKDKKSNAPSKKRKVIKRIIWFVVIVFLIVLIYLLARPKFKDVTIELGTKNIKVQDFLVSSIYKKGAASITDLKSINLSEVGEKEITLRFLKKEETVKLKIVDTTAPKVKFKEHTAYIDYQVNPEDFIESKEDLSEMTVSFEKEPEIKDYGDYPVKIVVSDKYGNKTVGETKLIITWLYGEVDVELGSSFSVSNVVIDVERFGKYITQEELSKVNPNQIRNL